MARSDFYQSPVLPKKLTDNFTKMIFPFLFLVVFLPIVLPANNYPDFVVNAATVCANYIPSISVFSKGSFDPVLSLVDGFFSWILIISANFLVIVMNLSGCNRKTCENLQKEFPELISGVEVSQLFYGSIILFLLVSPFVIANFSWCPAIFPGVVTGRGMSLHELIINVKSGGIISQMIIPLYYNRFGLGSIYGLIAFLSVGFVYPITALIRTATCKIIIYFDKH